MNRKISLGPLALMAMLAGCASQSPDRSHDQASVMRMQMRLDDMKCRSYGAAIGSQSYVQCRVQLDTMRQQQAAMRRAQQASLLQENSSYGSIY